MWYLSSMSVFFLRDFAGSASAACFLRFMTRVYDAVPPAFEVIGDRRLHHLPHLMMPTWSAVNGPLLKIYFPTFWYSISFLSSRVMISFTLLGFPG